MNSLSGLPLPKEMASIFQKSHAVFNIAQTNTVSVSVTEATHSDPVLSKVN